LNGAGLAFGHGTTNAWDEAVYLVLHALRLPPDVLTPYLERRVSPAQCRRAARLVAERIRRRIPAAYLTREAWLGDFKFYVDERVIVPRSYIAELLRERLAPWMRPRQRITRVLDLCTGSACLAIIAAKIFPKAQVDAIDISTDALAVGKRNVANYGLRKRIRLLESDLFSAIAGERYDLILCNPPYVDVDAMRKLPMEYRREPRIALAAGREGLDAVLKIMWHAAAHLTDEGFLVVEVGHHRRRVEAAFPYVRLIWPQTSGGDDCVFIVDRHELEGARRMAPVSRRQAPSHQASRAAAASRRK
jgi:ribosomal protein L3 glutamine methyltransferase